MRPFETCTAVPSETLKDCPLTVLTISPSRRMNLRPSLARLPILRPPKSPAPKPNKSRFEIDDVQPPTGTQRAWPQFISMLFDVTQACPMAQSASVEQAASLQNGSAASHTPALVGGFLSQ